MNPRTPHLPPAASILAAALFAVGCDGVTRNGPLVETGRNGDAGGGIGLVPPVPLMQSRAVDRTRLAPEVGIVGGPAIPMTRDGDRWRGTVGVAPGRDYTLSIVWVESIGPTERARDLPLATLEGTISVGPDGATFTADATRYVLEDDELDFDGDGRFNFAEREANTDPFGDGFPDDEPVGVPVAEIPAPLAVPPADDEPAEVPVAEGPTAEEPVVEEPVVEEPVAEVPAAEEPVVEVPVAEEPVAEVPTPEEPVAEVPDEDEEEDPAEEPRSVTADVLIPRVAPDDAPVIDGRILVGGRNSPRNGDWVGATSVDANSRPLLIDRLMIDNGTDEVNGQAFRAWSAVHDGEYLYVLVVVEDAGRRVRDSASADLIWQDDSLEVYVDGDNSGNRTYDDGDDDDSSRLIPLLAPGTTRRGTSEGLVPGFLSTDAPIRIDFATGPGAGPGGLRRANYEQDVYELRIDLDSAGIVPGRVFGFELQVNDDDDGGEREAKWGWAHPARDDEDVDFTYLDPSFMGTALLE